MWILFVRISKVGDFFHRMDGDGGKSSSDDIFEWGSGKYLPSEFPDPDHIIKILYLIYNIQLYNFICF